MEVPEESTDGEELEPANSVSPLQWVLFAARSAKRHRVLGLVLGLVIATLGVTAGLIIPAKYDAEARILFLQSASVAAALSTPNQQRQNTTTPIGESTELLMGKPSLYKVVEDADLLTHFLTHRSLPLRIKDSLFSLIREPMSDTKMKVMLSETLGTRMWINVKDSLITIHVTWTDPDMTLRLATLLQKRFLDMRKEQELAAINVAIAINEEELRNASQGIDVALQEVESTRERTRAATTSQTAPSDTKSSETSRRLISRRPATVSSEDTAGDNKRLLTRLAETRQKAQQVDDSWQRRVIDLKFQLNDLRTTYGPEHPTIIQQQARIREASVPPPELTQLREQERRLLAEIENASAQQEVERSKRAKEMESSVPRPAADLGLSGVDRRPTFAGAGTVVITEREEDPRIAPAKANLTAAIRRYTDVTQRLDAARIELTASQVALKYRYAVVAEPERPRKPTKPNRPIIIAGALFAACLLGFLAGAVKDLLSNRVFEPWQLKSIGLNVLGEVHLR